MVLIIRLRLTEYVLIAMPFIYCTGTVKIVIHLSVNKDVLGFVGLILHSVSGPVLQVRSLLSTLGTKIISKRRLRFVPANFRQFNRN